MSEIVRTLVITIEQRDDGKFMVSSEGADVGGDYCRREIEHGMLDVPIRTLDIALNRGASLPVDLSLIEWVTPGARDFLWNMQPGYRSPLLPPAEDE